jgi:hypothetical protein
MPNKMLTIQTLQSKWNIPAACSALPSSSICPIPTVMPDSGFMLRGRFDRRHPTNLRARLPCAARCSTATRDNLIRSTSHASLLQMPSSLLRWETRCGVHTSADYCISHFGAPCGNSSSSWPLSPS